MDTPTRSKETIDGAPVVWSEEDGLPYVWHGGVKVGLPNGDTVAALPLSKTGYRPADIVEVYVPVRAKRSLTAGLVIGLVAGVTGGAVFNALTDNSTDERDAAALAALRNRTAIVETSDDNEDNGPLPTETAASPTKSKPTATSSPKLSPTPSVTTVKSAPTTPEGCVAELPLDVKVGQMTVWGITADADMEKVALEFDKYHIGGGIIMKEPANIKSALADLKSRQQIPISLSTDQEGGDVQRIKSIGGLPSQQDMAKTKSPAEAEALMTEHYKKLKALNIDVAFAPVADVGTNLDNRLFGSDAATVAKFTNAYTAAAEKVGITPTYKHFPGLGRADGNTDFEEVVTTPPFDVIKKDFDAYESVKNKDKVSVMVGSSVTPGLTEDGVGKMAMFSTNTVNVLRNDLGFSDSVLYTDDLGAKAVLEHMGISEAFVAATAAGVDAKVIVGPHGVTKGKPNTLETHMKTNIRALESAIEEKRIDKLFVDAQVLRIFGQKGLNACTVLADVKRG